MLWGMRAVMFLSCGGIGVAVTLALVRLIGRRWKRGLAFLGLALGGSAATIVAMGLMGVAYASTFTDGATLEPSEKARFLGEAIATQMNWAAVALPIGLLVGGIIEWRRRRNAVVASGHESGAQSE